MNIVYYVQTNIICLIILLLVYLNWNAGKKAILLQYRIINWIVVLTGIFCISDIVGWCVQEYSTPIARVFNYAADIVYFVSIVTIAYLWFVFTLFRVGKVNGFESFYVIGSGIPMLLFVVFVCMTPFSGWIFTIDSGNMYHRGPLLIFHWLVVSLYVIAAELMLLAAYRRTDSASRREYYRACLGFAGFSLAFAIPQFIFYGLSTSQIGITIAILFLSMNVQRNMVQTDGLTGCHNRRALDSYLEGLLSKSETADITVIMTDINDFKEINDTYGHQEGDEILRAISNTIKDICVSLTSYVFLCRYGGDEFLLVGKNCSEDELKRLTDGINGRLDFRKDRQYEVSMSVGIATAKCSSVSEINELIKQSDSIMYEKKAEYKNGKE